MLVVFIARQRWPSCFLSIPCIYSIMLVITWRGGSLNKMSPSNFWSNKVTRTILKVSKLMFQISLLHFKNFFIFRKQSITLRIFKLNSLKNGTEVVEGGTYWNSSITLNDNGLEKHWELIRDFAKFGKSEGHGEIEICTWLGLSWSRRIELVTTLLFTRPIKNSWIWNHDIWHRHHLYCHWSQTNWRIMRFNFHLYNFLIICFACNNYYNGKWNYEGNATSLP